MVEKTVIETGELDWNYRYMYRYNKYCLPVPAGITYSHVIGLEHIVYPPDNWDLNKIVSEVQKWCKKQRSEKRFNFRKVKDDYGDWCYEWQDKGNLRYIRVINTWQ